MRRHYLSPGLLDTKAKSFTFSKIFVQFFFLIFALFIYLFVSLSFSFFSFFLFSHINLSIRVLVGTIGEGLLDFL